MASATKPMLVRDLQEGDCFFYTSPEEYAAREKRIEAFNEFRASMGEKPIDAAESAQLIQAAAGSYVVLTTVLATRERITLHIASGKKQIWYDGLIPVRFSPDRDAFEQRIEEMKQARKKMEAEEARLQRPHSKKRNAPAEIAERTLIANR